MAWRLFSVSVSVGFMPPATPLSSPVAGVEAEGLNVDSPITFLQD